MAYPDGVTTRGRRIQMRVTLAISWRIAARTSADIHSGRRCEQRANKCIDDNLRDLVRWKPAASDSPTNEWLVKVRGTDKYYW
jgi:hypothetical protein